MKKFKLTKNKKDFFGMALFQIKALKDFGDVKKGGLGGYLENETNLTHEGNAWVYENAQVCGKAQVYENAQVYGDAQVHGQAQVCGDARVYGNAEVLHSMYIKTGLCKTNLQRDLKSLVSCSLDLLPLKGKYIVYKRVNKDLTSEHDKTFKYPKKGIIEIKDYNPDPTISCGKGLHFSTANYYPKDGDTVILMAEVDIKDIICCLEGKIRCKKARILGICD